ncbi:hypothetical protein SAMN05428975_2200 [Mucilaginibacter sp. OK268]|uniref:hypothetical protein n=1 Tax=Mucilaginibacter sp. OK268 TaxID=1881048 RepID=UPI00088BFAD9|nr:hypothetical protein [Mucilaginibacter sp. OK268]SDP69870.1 hypothetical protein SAMN05428975_2200 [Mucilaginibacter sp. OK268]
MKKYLLIILLLFLSYSSYSQIKRIEDLLNSQEYQVINDMRERGYHLDRKLSNSESRQFVFISNTDLSDRVFFAYFENSLVRLLTIYPPTKDHFNNYVKSIKENGLYKYNAGVKSYIKIEPHKQIVITPYEKDGTQPYSIMVMPTYIEKKSDKKELAKMDGHYRIMNGLNSDDENSFILKNGEATLNLFGQTFIDVTLNKTSENNYSLYFAGVSESNAIKPQDEAKYSKTIPIATISVKGTSILFRWLGLYRSSTQKRYFTELNEAPANKEYVLKKS